MPRRYFLNGIFYFILSLALSAGSSLAQDLTNLGGDLTSDLPSRAALQAPSANISSEERRILQVNGFPVFHRFVTRQEGLGPVFNNASCGGCHVNNGRGPLRISRVPDVGSTMILKVSLNGLNSDGSPRNVPGIGEQVRDHTIFSGGLNKKTRIRLRWEKISGSYPDGTKYSLRKPNILVAIPGYRPRDLRTSLRMTPPVIGPGLLEAISEETILSMSDPFDVDQDGISGKPQYVLNRRSGLTEIGRFGFRASHPSVEQQSAAAAFNDMGVTNSLFPSPLGEAAELSEEDLETLVIYEQLGGVPQARNQNDADVLAGKQLFRQFGCDSCHRMTLGTSSSAAAELRDQVIHPFTDLLLHNMGRGLADKRAEHSASGNEWKTTPLWGLGFARHISKVSPRYLHDGRARSIEEAILWHGGEAEKAQRAFRFASKEDRAKLIHFLKSL